MEHKGRLFCEGLEQAARLVRLLGPSTGRSGCRRIQPGMGGDRSLRIAPFRLIQRCLMKALSDQAELVLVTPFCPAQPWSQLLLELACEPVLVFEENGCCWVRRASHTRCQDHSCWSLRDCHEIIRKQRPFEQSGRTSHGRVAEQCIICLPVCVG